MIRVSRLALVLSAGLSLSACATVSNLMPGGKDGKDEAAAPAATPTPAPAPAPAPAPKASHGRALRRCAP